MIWCGLMMDIMFMGALTRFIIYGTTWRFVISLIVFYSIRGIIQVTHLFFDTISNFLKWGTPTATYGTSLDFIPSRCHMEKLTISFFLDTLVVALFASLNSEPTGGISLHISVCSPLYSKLCWWWVWEVIIVLTCSQV